MAAAVGQAGEGGIDRCRRQQRRCAARCDQVRGEAGGQSGPGGQAGNKHASDEQAGKQGEEDTEHVERG